MIVGVDSATCLIAIPLLAVMPFATLIVALRMGAPTDQMHAGAMAGLAAGGHGALARSGRGGAHFNGSSINVLAKGVLLT